MAGAGRIAAGGRAHCRRTAANIRGADSFLVVRRHTNTVDITYSSHSNDSLYSIRKYIRFKFFMEFLWYAESDATPSQSFANESNNKLYRDLFSLKSKSCRI
ncbi:hypothetical protein [Burkholderia sp. Bp8998]|uniref:hypothetical protein n=1 Tax=Burkholderia sp. Bp8998 TaxID=2184557 RepID=UPI001639F2C5|nr:hypothetical protein [Burkholderia sp. Bp8998]